MKSIFEKLTQSPDEGFALKEMRAVGYGCPWHFHDECELVLTLAGGGHRIIGDNIAALGPGDLVLLGPGLPHTYQNDERLPGRRATVHCILIQFVPATWRGLLDLPAVGSWRRLLQRTSLGLHVVGAARQRVEVLMRRMLRQTGPRRIIAFLEILDVLARSRACRPIASPGFNPVIDPLAPRRVNRVCQFVNEHLDEPISVPQAAALVHLSDGAFSRFFRQHMGKTFPAFVNELRVGRACRLLAETDMNVVEIALACGYQNLSNFNRQFRRLRRCSPREYRGRLV